MSWSHADCDVREFLAGVNPKRRLRRRYRARADRCLASVGQSASEETRHHKRLQLRLLAGIIERFRACPDPVRIQISATRDYWDRLNRRNSALGRGVLLLRRAEAW